MSDDWGDDEWDWDDWSDTDDEPTPYTDSDGTPCRVPVLTAVFEDGPPSKPFACLVDDGLNQWPPAWEWLAHDDNGTLIRYIYKHIGDGRYSVALTHRLDA